MILSLSYSVGFTVLFRHSPGLLRWTMINIYTVTTYILYIDVRHRTKCSKKSYSSYLSPHVHVPSILSGRCLLSVFLCKSSTGIHELLVSCPVLLSRVPIHDPAMSEKKDASTEVTSSRRHANTDIPVKRGGVVIFCRLLWRTYFPCR